MMDFPNIIANKLKDFFNNDETIVPYDKMRETKKPHMRDISIKQNEVNAYKYLPNSWYFEIGNRDAQEYTPHYHILQNAQKIKNPGQGTKATKGSQEKKMYKHTRDYGRVSYRVGRDTGELIPFQEYRDSKFRDKLYGEGTYRENKHYQWIERALDIIVPQIATEIGAELVKEESVLNIRDNTLRYGR